MISTRKPDITTEGFDEVHPMSQATILANTPHASGLCSSFSSLFLRSMFTKRTDDYLKKTDDQLYQDAVQEEKEIIHHEQSGAGKGADHFAFEKEGFSSEQELIAAQDVADRLEKVSAAQMIYPTRTGDWHSVAFF